jgi:hypothetical protein
VKRLVAFAIISAAPLLAQQSAEATADALKLAADMRASYYHPDALRGLDCAAAVDFASLFMQLGQPVSPEAVNAAIGVAIKVHAVRGQKPVVDIAWAQEASPRREFLESGVRKLLESIFGIYWTFIVTPLQPLPSDKIHVEAGTEGGHIFVDSGGVPFRVEADRDNVPGKFQFENAVTKITLEPHYLPSPNPTPGDLRRMTSVDQSQQIGTNVTHVLFVLDYQEVGGFNVPHHVSYVVGDAFAVPVEFSACSVTRRTR